MSPVAKRAEWARHQVSVTLKLIVLAAAMNAPATALSSKPNFTPDLLWFIRQRKQPPADQCLRAGCTRVTAC